MCRTFPVAGLCSWVMAMLAAHTAGSGVSAARELPSRKAELGCLPAAAMGLALLCFVPTAIPSPSPLMLILEQGRKWPHPFRQEGLADALVFVRAEDVGVMFRRCAHPHTRGWLPCAAPSPHWTVNPVQGDAAMPQSLWDLGHCVANSVGSSIRDKTPGFF